MARTIRKRRGISASVVGWIAAAVVVLGSLFFLTGPRGLVVGAMYLLVLGVVITAAVRIALALWQRAQHSG